jgi:hypothetical protein
MVVLYQQWLECKLSGCAAETLPQNDVEPELMRQQDLI